MDTIAEIKRLENYRRQSRRAIPVHTALLLTAAFTIWLLSHVISVPIWATAIVLGMLAFTWIGDVINCFHCSRRLKTLRREQEL